MYTKRRFFSAIVLALVSAAICPAQSVTSARSGTLHYFEGEVSIDGNSLTAKASKFPGIKDQGILHTGKGRAEILLTPGVFLRVGEDSAIRMLDTRLISTRVDILSGSAVIESDNPQMSVKNSPVTLLYGDYEIHMVKFGLMEITSDPAEMKVFRGEAEVLTADKRAIVREGRLVPFDVAFMTQKFDPKEGDDLYLWARDRSQYLSAANMSSARSISQGSCFVACADGAGGWNGGWHYNPWFDMITYVPIGGVLWSPFGYGFFSPATIGDYYTPTGYRYDGGARSGPSARSPGGLASRSGNGSGQPVGNAGTFGSNGSRGGPNGGGVSGGVHGSGGAGPRGR